MWAMLKRINDVLPELVAGILGYGLIVQLLGVWFVEDRLRYSTGLWIGIAIAVAMAIQMALVILDTVNLAVQKKARARTALFALLRYVVVVALFVVVIYFRLGNVITMFLGMMGLKVAAYLQPFVHKLILKYRKPNALDAKTGKEASDKEKVKP